MSWALWQSIKAIELPKAEQWFIQTFHSEFGTSPSLNVELVSSIWSYLSIVITVISVRRSVLDRGFDSTTVVTDQPVHVHHIWDLLLSWLTFVDLQVIIKKVWDVRLSAYGRSRETISSTMDNVTRGFGQEVERRLLQMWSNAPYRWVHVTIGLFVCFEILKAWTKIMRSEEYKKCNSPVRFF